jgi:hypothetical protein
MVSRFNSSQLRRPVPRLAELHRLKARCAFSKPEWELSLAEVVARDRFAQLSRRRAPAIR